MLAALLISLLSLPGVWIFYYLMTANYVERNVFNVPEVVYYNVTMDSDVAGLM